MSTPGSAADSQTRSTQLEHLMQAGEVIDLSWSLAEDGPIFPGQQPVEFRPIAHIDDPDLPLHVGHLSFMEHSGTHMDAPSHAIKGGRHVDELPFSDLVGPACKLDLTQRCSGFADFDVSVEDLERHEREFGQVPGGAIVLLHTGWDERYVDPKRYIVETDDSWHWPGVSAEAAGLLADRGVRGVGIDTIGLDGGHVAMTLAAHRAVLGSGAFILENLAHLAEVPPRGALVLALPIKTRGGSGGPARVYALT